MKWCRALVFLLLGLFAPLSASEASDYGNLVRQGHTLLQAGEKGRAAYFYEKALVISDTSSSVRQNLAAIRKECGADQYAIETHPLVKLVFFMYYSCTRSDLISIMYFAVLALLLFMGITVFTGKKIAWCTHIVCGTLILFILLSCAAFFYREHEAGANDRAVILSPVPLFARTEMQGEPLIIIAEASSVYGAVSPDSKSCRIVLPNGVSGYVPSQAVAFINRE
jgi:hypothetical protein